MKPLIVVLEQIHDDGIQILRSFADVQICTSHHYSKFSGLLENATGVVVKSVTLVDDQFFEVARKLKFVGRAGTGLDNIAISSAQTRGIQILNVPTANSTSAAEFTITQMLVLAKRIPEILESVKNGDYRRSKLEGRELFQMSIGLVGLGNVGIAVANRLIKFCSAVHGWDPDQKRALLLEKIGGTTYRTLDDLLGKTDIVSLHCSLNDSNTYLFNRPQFAQLKPGTIFINTARARLISDDALLEALDAGFVSKAALDILEPEPPYETDPSKHRYSHKLLNHPNILITPHIAASTIDAQREVSTQLAHKIKEALNLQSI